MIATQKSFVRCLRAFCVESSLPSESAPYRIDLSDPMDAMAIQMARQSAEMAVV
jgi:hypothetical protein